jgi:hypothetical protein
LKATVPHSLYILLIVAGAVGSVFAQRYDDINVVGLDDYFDVPTPPVNEYVDLGGIQLRVDRTKWGVELSSSNHGLLGRFLGNDVELTATEIVTPQSLDQLAQRAAPNGDSLVRVERVSTSHAVHGIKVVYADKSSYSAPSIRAIRYFFAGPQGRVICFEARPTSSHPDWSDTNDLILDTLSLAKTSGTKRSFSHAVRCANGNIRPIKAV